MKEIGADDVFCPSCNFPLTEHGEEDSQNRKKLCLAFLIIMMLVIALPYLSIVFLFF
ncbi:MAG: hypothetical protein ACTSR8_01990 [Promethearchaeota archaeon]